MLENAVLATSMVRRNTNRSQGRRTQGVASSERRDRKVRATMVNRLVDETPRNDASGGVVFLVTTAPSIRFVSPISNVLRRRGVRTSLICEMAPSTHSDFSSTHSVTMARSPDPTRDLRSVTELMKVLRRLRPRLVVYGTPKAALLGAVATRALRVPNRVYAVHGLRFETMSGLKRKMLISFERLICRLSTQVLVDSASLVEVLTSERLAKEGKLVLLGHGSSSGVDLERFSPDRIGLASSCSSSCDAFYPTLGFVGRLSNDKGITDLVSVFDRIRLAFPTARLLIVGDEDPNDPVDRQTICQIGSDTSIVHAQWTDDVMSVYRKCDLLIFPSRREGLPNVPLEAQAAGVPVVGYSATGTVNAIPREFLADLGDVDGLAAIACRLLKERELLNSASEQVRAFVAARFDRTVVAPSRAEFIIDLIRESGYAMPEAAS